MATEDLTKLLKVNISINVCFTGNKLKIFIKGIYNNNVWSKKTTIAKMFNYNYECIPVYNWNEEQERMPIEHYIKSLLNAGIKFEEYLKDLNDFDIEMLDEHVTEVLHIIDEIVEYNNDSSNFKMKFLF